MAFDFPNSPTIGQTYPSPPVAGQPVYTWDGEKWATGSGMGSIYIADAAPAAPVGSLWWKSDTGLLYVRYNDGTSTQWVIAAPQPDTSTFLPTGGGTMTGPLVLSGDPTAALQATTKQYSDRAVHTDFAQSFTAAQRSQARANIDVLKKNYIINGAMQISQENGTTVITAVGGYPVDQFFLASSNAGASSMAQVASITPAGSPNRIRFTVTTADASVGATDYSVFQTVLEGLRVADLRFGLASAKTVTVQFGVRAPAGTYCVVFANGPQNRSYVVEYVITAGQANTDVVVAVVIPGDVTGTWANDNTAAVRILWAMMCGANYAFAAGSWQAVGAIASPNQFNLMGTVNNVFELFDVGLYEGTVAPPFAVPDYASERTLCRRYFLYETYSSAMWLHCIDSSNVYRRRGYVFRPEMRAAPAVTITTGVSGTFGGGMPAVANITAFSCELQGDLTAAAGYAYVTSVKANARM